MIFIEYYEGNAINIIERHRELLNELPCFCQDFFVGIGTTTQPRTRLGYVYDLKLFFNFLCSNCQEFQNNDIIDLTLKDLELVTPTIIARFLDYTTYYTKKNEHGTYQFTNEERGKSRKLSAIKSMFNYFYKIEKLEKNPASLVSSPKINKNAIINLEPNEVACLLDNIEDGKNLTNREKKYHSYTGIRDLAIVTLLLGTGMRISECIGIDIKHIDFDINGIKITRKGGKETVIYFGKEVELALNKYLDIRTKMTTRDGDENALFLSMQKRRITDRAVQNLVKKYSQITTPLKKITPHKLRSTYGTNLYRETGDIYLVADVLGHEDVNTTKKHYAKLDDDRRRSASNIVKLRRE